MASFILKTTATVLLSVSLAACGGTDTNEKNSAEINAATTPAAAQAIAANEIADMSPVEMMEYATVNSTALADKLALVTDEATAREAITELRAMGPRMAALGERLKNVNEADLGLSIKTMRVVSDFGKAQMRVAAETSRIMKDHPELRDLFEEEFEDIEIKIQ